MAKASRARHVGKAREDSPAAASYKAPTPQPVAKPTITGRVHLGFASRMRSEHSDEQSAEQLQEVKHPKARIAHRGSCASPDAIFGSHRLKCKAVADSLEEAGDRLFTFTRLPGSQWKSARTTNAIERLHEGRRRQTSPVARTGF